MDGGHDMDGGAADSRLAVGSRVRSTDDAHGTGEIVDGDLFQVYRNSIEIQIDETGKDFVATRNPQAIYGSSLHKTGAVYGLAPATRWASKAVSPRFAEGYWNAYEITVKDDRVSVSLNGEPVVRKAQLPAELVKPGFIGLQCHTDIVQFRNIRIREL